MALLVDLADAFAHEREQFGHGVEARHLPGGNVLYPPGQVLGTRGVRGSQLHNEGEFRFQRIGLR